MLVMMIKCREHKAEVIENETATANNDTNNETLTNNSNLLSDYDKYFSDESDNWTSDPDAIASGESEQEILIFLLTLMALSGLLAIISNGMVILADVKSRKQIFERPIVSLAWVDVLTGCIGTPLVCCIYYYQCKYR